MTTINGKALGFRHGTAGVHTSRTLMLEELTLLLNRVKDDAPAARYTAAIADDNVLGKPTRSTRLRTAERLTELYALDPDCPLFRLFRHFWSAGSGHQPLLAFLLACARDPLLRDMTPFVLAVPEGELVSTASVAEHLAQHNPNRFGDITLVATAQRLASSWTQAGFLLGKVKKRRVQVQVSPVVVAFALLLGYLSGVRGKRLIDTPWAKLLDTRAADLSELAVEASKQGWLRFKTAGAVVEVSFPGLLKPSEEQAAHESH